MWGPRPSSAPRTFVLLLILAALMVAAWLIVYANTLLIHVQTPLEFTVSEGSSLRAATAQLQAQGVVGAPLRFQLLARLHGDAARIQAGSYEITGPLTPMDLLKKLTSGDQAMDRITLIEGWTFAQARAALDASPRLRHDTRDMPAGDIARELGIAAGSSGNASPEGWLFPDTYTFARGSSDWGVLRRAHRAMEEQLAAAWEKRAPDAPFAAPYDALILASIVEKETGRAEDRPHVARVFVNRLTQGMMLQTDPSVIYGIANFNGNLRRDDLTSDGPYNTYMHAGLPPTPIALPGAESLKAVMNPPAGEELYFVARGDGSSQFSDSLNEHVRAVDRYQKRRGDKPPHRHPHPQ